MPGTRTFALVLAALILTPGCHHASTPSPTPPLEVEPPRVEAPTAPPPLEDEAATPTQAPAQPAALAVGWAKIPVALDPAADQHNRKGLAHLRAGRNEAALASLEQALAADPDYAWARYNHACALARLGRSAAAVAEVERLLLEDLPTFGRRWAQDEDLAAAHATAPGQRLDARLPEIRRAWRAAIERGIPAMTYRARSARGAGGAPRIPQQGLRLGVYDPTTRRFVPAVPRVPSALGWLFDRRSDRALVLAGELVMAEYWLVQARRLDVRIFDLTDPSRTVLSVDDVDTKHPNTERGRVAVEAALEGNGALVTLRELDYEPKGTLSLHVTSEGVALGRIHVSPSALRLHVDASGAFTEVPPPPGLSLEGRTLRVRGRKAPIELGPGHGAGGHLHVARTPDGRWAMVFTEQAGCREEAFERYVLDRVDLEHGAVTRLSTAPTHAGVALGADGSVYLDDGARVLRFAPDSTDPIDDVPPGVRFVTPDYDRDCSI